MNKQIGSIGLPEWIEGKGIAYPVTFELPNGRPYVIYVSESSMLAAISRQSRQY